MEPERTFLILEAKGDPQYERYGFPAREPAYRLKLALKRLLRDYGLKCVEIRNPNTQELAALPEPEPERSEPSQGP